MNSKTNIQTVGIAAALATIFMWLLGYFAPGLMGEAPTGLEAAITGIFSVLVGYVVNDNRPQQQRQSRLKDLYK